MTIHELALQEATNVAKELIARNELKLAEAVLDKCIERATPLRLKEILFHCHTLMMYCKKDDDAFLLEAKNKVPELIHTTLFDENGNSNGDNRDINDKNRRYRYVVHWHLILIYQEKHDSQTDEAIKQTYNTKITLYKRMVNQWSFTKNGYAQTIIDENEIRIRSTIDCATDTLKQEAEKILKPLSLHLFSNSAPAHETLAYCKNLTGDIDTALENCNQALLLTPNSTRRLELKLDILLKHIRLHLNNNDDVKLIPAIKQSVDIKPSAEMYFKLGLAYSRQSKFQKAFLAFKKARRHQKEYESESVSLNIIHALFQSAETRKQFKVCAIKLSNHLTRYPSTEKIEAIQTMVDYFRKEKLLLDCAALYLPDPGTPRKKAHILKEESDESSLSVPQDIKEKTREALQRMSFYHDKSVSGRDALDEEKINLDEVHQIGNKNSHAYAYIPTGTTSQENLAKYLKAIEKPIKGPGSKGKACPKRLTDGRIEIKILGKGGNSRLLSTACFFTFKLNKTASENEGDAKQLDTIYRFKEKTHNQV